VDYKDYKRINRIPVKK
jgi:hypothetical protein